MVTEELLRKSYKSRPRVGVVVQGIVSLLFVALAGVFLFLYISKPDLFAFLTTVETSFPEPGFTLYQTINYYYLHLVVFMLLLLVPINLCVSVAASRAFYWFFAIPSILLEIAFIPLYIVACIPPLAASFPGDIVILLQDKILPIVLYGQLGILAIASILEILYPALPCFTYREIYRLRRDRIVDARDGKLKDPLTGEERTPRDVRKAFSSLYRKKNYKALIDLLYSHVFAKARTGKLTQDEFHHFAEFTCRLEAKARTEELEFLYGENDFKLLSLLYERMLALSKTKDIGQRKATEDRAFFDLVKKNETSPAPQAPAPQPPVSQPQLPKPQPAPAPTPAPKPVPKPAPKPASPIGEAWKQDKK